MLKAEVNEKTTSIEINGTLPQICTDLTRILSAINERLSQNDPEIGHEFRVVFTYGFMNGICFDDDREHMEHYLAEGKKKCEKNDKAKQVVEFLEGFIDFLKEKRSELENAKAELDDIKSEVDDDEAE